MVRRVGKGTSIQVLTEVLKWEGPDTEVLKRVRWKEIWHGGPETDEVDDDVARLV